MSAEDRIKCAAPDAHAECSLQPAELARWKANQDLAIIDLRNAEDFQQLRIPSSINYAPYALKTKSYLKDRKILLVGDSFAQHEASRTCQQLLNHGFQSVKYLHGGLLAWQKHFGQLEGDKGLLSKLWNMPVNEFFKEFSFRPWLLVDTSSDAKPFLQLPQVEFLALPISRDRKKFIQLLEVQIKKRRVKEPNLAVALLGAAEKEQTDLEALLRDISIDDVYFVEGGKIAVERYIQANLKIINHLQKRSRGSRCG